jgi:hypothetical protein
MSPEIGCSLHSFRKWNLWQQNELKIKLINHPATSLTATRAFKSLLALTMSTTSLKHDSPESLLGLDFDSNALNGSWSAGVVLFLVLSASLCACLAVYTKFFATSEGHELSARFRLGGLAEAAAGNQIAPEVDKVLVTKEVMTHCTCGSRKSRTAAGRSRTMATKAFSTQLWLTVRTRSLWTIGRWPTTP